MRRGALLTGIAAAAVALAGCGSGSGQRLTQAEFKATTDAICASYTRRAERELGSSEIAPTSLTSIQHVTRLFGEQLEDLRAVRPPVESARKYSQVLALYGQIENTLVQAARAARRGDRRGLTDLGKELDAVGRQVDALGFRCE